MPDQKRMTPERGSGVRDRGRAIESERPSRDPRRERDAPDPGRAAPDPGRAAPDPGQGAPGGERAAPDPGRAAPDPGQGAPGGERAAPDRGRGTGDRGRGASGQQGRGVVAGGADDLWPPFTVPPGDRDARAHRGLREYAARDQRGRGRSRLAPSLSRDEIVGAAIAVADAEGADAVSMRRIAQELRSGTMSLYWHVASKEHLLDLMLDALVAEVRVPEPSGDWRADLQAVARENRAMLLRHRWVMDFVGGRPPLGPNTMLNLDRSMAMLDGLGVGMAMTFCILETISTYVLGATLREMREMRVQRDQEQSGITPDEWEPVKAAWRDRLDADGRFTHVVRFLDADIDPDAEETRDERFDFGLDCVLDGIAAKIAEASHRPTA